MRTPTPDGLRQKRYILDNDGTNIFAHPDPLNDEVIDRAVQECPNAVTTHLICPNWCGKFFFPTQVGEVLPESCAPAFHALLKNGKDPLGMFIERERSTGRETFITYRTNDVHGADDPNHPGTSEFKKAHPDFVVDPTDKSVRYAHRRLRLTGNWMARCLDYSRPEVRDYYLASLTELAQRYVRKAHQRRSVLWMSMVFKSIGCVSHGIFRAIIPMRSGQSGALSPSSWLLFVKCWIESAHSVDAVFCYQPGFPPGWKAAAKLELM